MTYGFRTMIQMRQQALTVLTMTTLAVLLTGCKSEPKATGSSAPSAVEAPQTVSQTQSADASTDDRPVIACFGDSLTAGYGVEEESSYPTNLQHDLDVAGYHYRVVNFGISGDTTKDGLARIDRVIAAKPAVVIVEFGGNDGLRGVPVANSRQNLDDILSRLQQTGTKIAMAGITLPPQYSAPYIKDFNQTYTILAKKYQAPLLPFVLKDVYGVPGSIQPDGIHPTAQGCIQVAKNVMGLIEPLLKK